MSDAVAPLHYVCTHDEARALIEARDRFWVSNCGCRERRGQPCARSRLDVCLSFAAESAESGSGKRAISAAEALAVLGQAAASRLVARPWRNDARTETEGICFCCDDCCEFFLNRDEPCDRGRFIAQTDARRCDSCGACLSACPFHARQVIGGKVVLRPEECYGCGLCVDACPAAGIRMVPRDA